MTDEHTPTTDQVREEWQYGHQDADMDGNVTVSFDEAGACFDRWYMSERRKWQAGTLRDAADRLDELAQGGTAFNAAAAVVRKRADRIERGG